MVIHVKPRDQYDMGEESYDATMETTQFDAPQNLENLISGDDVPIPSIREEEDGE